jgi:hypothetical protein
LKEDVRNRWHKVKREVQGDLLAEGIIAIFEESRHIEEITRSGNDLLEIFTFQGDIEYNNPSSNSFDERIDEFISVLKSRSIRDKDEFVSDLISLKEEIDLEMEEGIADDEFLKDVELNVRKGEFDRAIDLLVDLKRWISGQFTGGDSFKEDWNFFFTNVGHQVTRSWPDAREDMEFVLRTSDICEFPELKDTLEFFAHDYFTLPSWRANYGGESWAEITQNILKLWDEYPTADAKFIDHVVDLAHNTSTWLDKFERGHLLLDALDLKFDARSPKEYVDQLSDRKIIAGVKRALPVNSAPMRQ